MRDDRPGFSRVFFRPRIKVCLTAQLQACFTLCNGPTRCRTAGSRGMEQVEHKVDRSGWPEGEWDGEPDCLQWTDQETGLPCLIVRARMGALCGYVAVERGHPAYRKDDDAVEVFDVHGGITYAELCHDHICHVPEPGKPKEVWWLGFDCAHCDDLVPKMLAVGGRMGFPKETGTYRNVAYVQAECASLAKQLAAQVAA